MYDRVLLPTDGSETAAQAAPHAIGHAARFDADLHALFVIEQATSPGVVGQAEAAQDALGERGREAIDTIREEAREAGVQVDGAVRMGVPSQEILSYADEVDADLVVMSTHGRSGVGRFLMGSVTERVLRQSDVPVLAAHG